MGTQLGSRRTLSSSDGSALSRRLVDCYFGMDGAQLVKHHIDSYNDFVSTKIDQVVDAFNPVDICNTWIPESSTYKYIISISLTSPSLSRPKVFEKDGSSSTMMPNDARLRNLTYAAPLSCDLVVTSKVYSQGDATYHSETRRIVGVSLGKVPIMVRSRYCMLSHTTAQERRHDECQYDYGGYFIVNGNEKVLVSQDRIAENKVYVFLNTKSTYFSHIAEIRSYSETSFGVSKSLSLKLCNRCSQYGTAIKLCVHSIKQDVPVFVVFRALGVESDRDICALIVADDDPNVERIRNELQGCMDEASTWRTTLDSCEYLRHQLAPSYQHSHASATSSAEMLVRNVLRKDVLPHVGPDPSSKAVFLGYMVSQLLRCSLGLRPLDDRDSYLNKHIDSPGILLANLFRQYFGKVIKDMRMLVQKDINNGSWRASGVLSNILTRSTVHKFVKAAIIENGLKYGLATGNWGVKASNMRQGISQMLNRMTYNATLSHMRRINTPIEKTGKLVQPRKLHPTQWGIMCPAETPEGTSVGLVKNMALTTTISISSSSDHVTEIVLASDGCVRFGGGGRGGVDATAAAAPFPRRRWSTLTTVFVNGNIVCLHSRPDHLHSVLRTFKLNGTIDVTTGIGWDISRREFWVSTEGGRFLRPLLTTEPSGAGGRCLRLLKVDDGALYRQLMSTSTGSSAGSASTLWQALVLSGSIEYVDVCESKQVRIGMTPADLDLDPSITHVELAQYAILGVMAGSIPFCQHNQAPRNTYQSAMGKQAIGVYTGNFRHRLDTMGHVLCYPQKPLVSTHTSRIMNGDRLPCGLNVMVAFACFTGFNQEDSVIVNRSALDRGLLSSTLFRVFREQNNKNHSTGEEEYFCRPDSTASRSLRPSNYSKLEEDGFVKEGTYVEAGDVIIGKCMPQKTGHVSITKDASVVLKNNEKGVIDRNCHSNRYFTNTTGDGYTFAKVRIRQTRVPTIGDKVSCYTADHQVLTRRDGWVPVSEICATEHEVACLADDGGVTYSRPVEVQRSLYRGHLVHIRGVGVDLLVTPEHRCLVRTGPPPPPAVQDLDLDVDGGGYTVMTAADVVDVCALGGEVWIPRTTYAPSARSTSARDEARAALLSASSGQFSDGDVSKMTLEAGWVVEPPAPARESESAIGGPGALRLDVASVDARVEAFEIRCDGAMTPVFCCTVSVGRGIIFVRRNGCSSWCGNSRHGQKGTIGMIFPEHEMPYTSSGMVPSLIINPHAIPSRMTIGQLMEALESKVAALTGRPRDATPFVSRSLDDIIAELSTLGVEKHGDEIMYNPQTGEQIKCAVFVCPTYYQRLKHMVEDKVHSRGANGPVVLLTRQPAEGRARDGGLRLGEMEVECLWAHGTMHFLKERFVECSDNYRVFVCADCGKISTVNPERGLYFCKACKNLVNFSEMRIPYASKLLLQEIEAMSIGTSFTNHPATSNRLPRLAAEEAAPVYR